MQTDLSPSRPRALSPLVLGALALVLAALVFARLSAYGIWDPWELTVADAARKLADGTQVEQPASLATRLVGLSLSLFGTREWAGRLPMALCGLLLLSSTAAWVYLLAGARRAAYAALILASTPLFLLHSREMIGATPAMLGTTLVMMGSSAALFREGLRSSWVFGLLLTAVFGAVIGALTAGIMSAVLPPLLAVSAWLLMSGRHRTLRAAQRTVGWLILTATGVLAAGVIRAVLRHAADPTVWLGAAPLDGALITYERPIEHLFHGFAPWSAVLPTALATLLRTRESDPVGLGKLALLWAALGYAAQSLYLSSFGPLAFLAPAALAVAAALWLADREESERADTPELIIILLLVGLLIRDFALYPGSPLGALEIDAKAPDVFNPKRAWAAVLGLFAVSLVVTSFARGQRERVDYRAPYRALRDLWNRSVGHKGWVLVAGALLVGFLCFGVAAFAAPRALRLTSLGTRIVRALLFIPLALPAVFAGCQLLYRVSGSLVRYRAALPLAAAVCVGAYTSFAFQVELSTHLSPRVVFDSYNKLAAADEPLAQHRVEGRAAAYYAKGEVRDIVVQSELVDFLANGGRRWAVLPSDQLPEVDLAFRKRTGRHLFVPARDNAKVMLVASLPIAGKPDANPLSLYVRKEVPPVQHKVNAVLDDAVELIGYNLDLPRRDSVGPGQTFRITWIWRAKRANLGAYQIFLHLDADNQRVNGDHDPVDGKYPVRLWDEGDVIVDKQEISVPATSPAGVYTLYVGMFRGESRMKVTAGPHDPADRVIAGTVRVQ